MLRRCLGLASLSWLPSGQHAAVSGPRALHSTATQGAASLPALADAPPSPSPLTDLTAPASWYPRARALRRRIVCHLGPTNSGKTHAALECLKQAGAGVYCGPLRLLAWEVAERLNASGVACNLVTGQEKRESPGARHTACTVEMASLGRVVEVAVVDEIQMMADRSRGWSFTRALLGLPAQTLHVCGDPAALPLLEQLCAEAGDELEVRQYERLSPLRPSTRALGELERVGRGDCVVAFSRREVHAIRRQIEQLGKHKCCVVYGGLPPEARSQQAVLFNKPRTGYNVMAASDAVGMGLNLNIRRVVFTTLSKFDGIQERPLTVAEIKQIGGRAGRYGSRFPEGVVTTLQPEDLPALQTALGQHSEPLDSACIFPTFAQLALFASQRPKEGLAEVLERFAEEAVLGSQFFFAHYEDMRTLAVMLKHLPLSLKEAYLFCLSPADPADTPVATALLHFATAYSKRGLVTPALILHPPLALARSEADLQSLEATHRIYDLYLWLCYRFEDRFEGREEAAAARAVCATLIDESIRKLGALSSSGSSSAKRSKALEDAAAAAAALNAAAAAAGPLLAAQARSARWSGAGEQRGWREGARSGRSGSSSESESEDESWRTRDWRLRKRAYAKHR